MDMDFNESDVEIFNPFEHVQQHQQVSTLSVFVFMVYENLICLKGLGRYAEMLDL